MTHSPAPSFTSVPAADPKALLAQQLRALAPAFIAATPRAALLQQMQSQGLAQADAQQLLDLLSADPLLAQARTTALALRKRDWLLDLTERHHALQTPGIERMAGLSSEAFLRRYYAASRPVILVDEMADWPALAWTPQRLRERVGSAVIEYQGGRNSSREFEVRKDDHKREMPFDRFLDAILQPDAGNDAYITAYNSGRNTAALSALHADLRPLPKFLQADVARGMPWIGPAGTFTPLHHDLTNNLVMQVVGRKQIKLVAAAHAARVANHHHVFSEIRDLDTVDLSRYPDLGGTPAYDVILHPGEMLYIPIGWWHQVRALDFSITYTYTSFLWPNQWHASYPAD